MGATLDFLKVLSDAQVEFVLIGGLAAFVHGSTRITEDVDVCAPLDSANLEKIVRALTPYHPVFRFHPKQPPMPADPGQLKGFHNLNLATDLVKIDILDEVTGIGGYEEVLKHSTLVNLGQFSMRVLDLDLLIVAKKAAGRLKDRMALPELEALRKHHCQDNRGS